MKKEESLVQVGASQIQGFGSESTSLALETASSAVAAQAKAATEARYIMAVNRPRDMDNVRSKLLSECRRPKFAAVARYNKPIGRGIEGPTIRFVETAMRCMGNILPESAVIYDDSLKRIIKVSVTDLEANLTYSRDVVVDKTVERSNAKGQKPLSVRKNSYGKDVYTVIATDDELLNKQGALESKAIRTLGLRLIPGDIVEEAQELCISIANSSVAEDPDAAKKKLVDAFDSIGVSPSDLSEYLAHDLAKSSPSEIIELRAVYAAILDGEAAWGDAMNFKKSERGEFDKKKSDSVVAAKGTKAIKANIDKRNKPRAIEQINACTTIEGLNGLMEMLDKLKGDEREKSLDAFNKKFEEIESR